MSAGLLARSHECVAAAAVAPPELESAAALDPEPLVVGEQALMAPIVATDIAPIPAPLSKSRLDNSLFDSFISSPLTIAKTQTSI
jgi:hypothetical protein